MDKTKLQMSKRINTYAAKASLSALLERVARGEEITITKNGKPIARLVPAVRPDVERQRRAAIARINELRKGLTLGTPVTELINEGRMRLVRKLL
jgi:prevent-host-death family protein